MTAKGAGAFMADFRYQGVVLDPAGLRYSPHPDIIFPSVIFTAPFRARALGDYYLYYAPHDRPGGLCLAYADRPEGPWTEHPANPLVRNEWAPHYAVSHVSSPHAVWNPEAGRLFLYFHGENRTTRYATSRDGVRFAYGGVCVDTGQFGRPLKEASYARVFRLAADGPAGRYAMLFMGNDAGTRNLYLAWSRDGRRWALRQQPFLTPPPGTNQMGPGWLFGRGRSLYILAFGNRSDSPEYDPVSDLYLYETTPRLAHVRERGRCMDRSVAGPDNRRLSDPCLLETRDRLYLFLNVGRRLRQMIALAVAVQGSGSGSGTAKGATDVRPGRSPL